MKLRNKKTGEINLGDLHLDDFNSLAELNAEWEDYEEDELFYIISSEHKDGYICALKEEYKELCDTANKLGIGFETEEEARKAVEKLKAWKRLKDKGFRFDGWTIDDGLRIAIRTNTDEDDIYDEDKRKIKPDLDLVFGDEE